MVKVKYVVLFLIMVSTLIGGFGQLIALNQTAAVYNAYFQLGVGFILFIWLAHKAIGATEVRIKHPIKNARDSK